MDEGQDAVKSERELLVASSSTATKSSEILKAGAASVGCLLAGAGLVAVPLGSLFFLGSVFGSWTSLWPFLAIAAVGIGFFLLRKYTVNTTGWFVLASVFFIIAVWTAGSGNHALFLIFYFVCGWWAMYMNNVSAMEKSSTAAPAPMAPTPPPEPFREVVLNENGQLVETPSAITESVAPAAAASKPARPVGVTIGCVTASIGALLVMLGIVTATLSTIGLVGDALAGVHGPINQDWAGANNQMTFGAMLLVAGLITFFYYFNKKK